MKIGFTGTHLGMSNFQKDQLRHLLAKHAEDLILGSGEFHHGDCIGADAEAVELGRELGYKIHCHPPINEKHRAFCPCDVLYPPEPYLVRDLHIVLMTEILIAAPISMVERRRSGTWSTIRYAQKAGRLAGNLFILRRTTDDTN